MATATASPTDPPTIPHHKSTGCDGDSPVDDLHHDGISRSNMKYDNNNHIYNNNIHKQNDKATKNSGKIVNHLYDQTGHRTGNGNVKGQEATHERNIEQQQKKGAQSVGEQQIVTTDQKQQQSGNGTITAVNATVKRGRERSPKSPTTTRGVYILIHLYLI